jgi:hypothetical protein
VAEQLGTGLVGVAYRVSPQGPFSFIGRDELIGLWRLPQVISEKLLRHKSTWPT